MDAAARPKKRLGAVARIFGLRDFGVLVAAVLIAAFFSVITPTFLTSYNLFNILRQTAELGIIAMAMTMLIVAGEFDLSVGGIYAVAGVVTGVLAGRHDVNIWWAALAGMTAALLLGLLNAVLIASTRINSFIATLSTMMVYRGVAMVLSEGQPISFRLDFFMDLFGRAELFGVLPVPVVWFAAWGVLSYVLLHRTTFGVRVFATGDNREAAELAGIKTTRVKATAFLLTALASGLAALISLSFLRTVTPTQGTGLELEAIAAAVIGGTAMSGGVGSILGTFLGTFIMAEVRTGLVLLGTDAYVQDAFVGLVIALAVIVNVRLSTRRR
ncbi:ABC transporter permease [Anaeromyxobacter oryzae]|uniref:Ribose ABC transporter permease n=1 Tax=Anaeromyxobacter oryzae TaxID=2918170 RepID=A0ABM7X0R4_9BACT|nr:ABC transporter permease [Anaeromyxobacter oryzae]BDG05408.1 ribose ABC transporter permease [Anaeromyxobacter oryzae]